MAATLIRLGKLASARSGDKGNHANVAVFVKTKDIYEWLCESLTAEVVAAYFAPLGVTRVQRYEAPNVLALNFMLHDALAGGASRSLRIDTQGKTLGLAILELKLAATGNGVQP